MDCTIQPNLDFIGVGIRAPLYLLSLAAPIARVLDRESLAFEIINGALTLFNLFLFSGAVYAIARNTLDLFHALCISFLLFLALPVVGRPDDLDIPLRGRSPTAVLQSLKPEFSFRTVMKFIHGVPLLAYYIFLDNVYGNLDNFGPRPECNPTVRITVLGAAVPATAPTIPWMVSLLFAAAMVFSLFQMAHMGAELMSESIDYDPDDRDGYELISGLLSCIYFIACLEAMIRQNRLGSVPRASMTPWQIVATITSVLALIAAMATYCLPRSSLGRFYVRRVDVTRPTTNFGEALFIILLDLVWNTLGGVLASLAGASASGIPASRQIAGLGALGGFVKSAVSSFLYLIAKTDSPGIGTLAIVLASAFIIPYAVTAVISSMAIGSVPDALTTASMVTAVPLLLSNTFLASWLSKMKIFATTGAAIVLFIIGFDALSGYTFARVAQNNGFDAIKGNAAAGAGVVFALVTTILQYSTLLHVAERDFGDGASPFDF